MAARHELDRHRNPVPHLEQRLDELVGRAGVRGPARQQRLVRALERGRGGRRKRPAADASMSQYFQFSAQTASR